MRLRPILPRHECTFRLQMIFPRAAFDPVLSNPLAGAAIAAMLYVNAVAPDDNHVNTPVNWARPTMCLWMSDEAFERSSDDERRAWYLAALTGKKAVERLLKEWDVLHRPWYGDNSRETLRDETFAAWLDHGAIRVRHDILTTSGRPRWALTSSFADLFLPDHTNELLPEMIDQWSASHMDPGSRLRIHTLHQRQRKVHAVTVALPDGTMRYLEPGMASLILKDVIEKWSTARLGDPVVLTISQPGDKVFTADNETLRKLGLSIDIHTLLPDAVIVDISTSPPSFWIVEAVVSDGPVTEDRRRQLLRWTEEQRIPAGSCYFLSAFTSRYSSAARRRLKDLAVGTFAWYADEPARELAWYEIDSRDEEE